MISTQISHQTPEKKDTNTEYKQVETLLKLYRYIST